MRELLLLLILLLAHLTHGQQCNISGDCKGNSLDFDIVNSHRECLEQCNTIEGCEWYTYDSNDGFCNSLSDCNELDSTCTTCISGENECQLPLMCFVPGECHGTYIDHIDVATAEECLRRCHNDYPECNYFSFFAEGVCNLLESCVLDDSQSGVVSGERNCHEGEQQAHTKIFLQLTQDTEWIHMPSQYGKNMTECNSPPAYPLNYVGTVAAIINGSLTVCGGWISENECFGLDARLNVWVEFPSMDVGRGAAAAVVTPNGWWITGGGTSGVSSSLLNGSSWMAGPNIPSYRRGHCLVQVNLTHTFIAGGNTGSTYLDDAYIFDWTTDVWTELERKPSPAGYLACAIYNGSIMAAGGRSTYKKVELFDLASGEWTTLPDLPTNVDGAFLFYDNNDLILVNGAHGSLLRFNDVNQTFSIIQGQTLPLNHLDIAAIPVSDEHLSGCK